ncbi:YrzQ family protein [Bacillus sp. SCS-153A]
MGTLNKTMASMIGLGVGIAATMASRRSNMMNGRNMKRMRKQIKKMF